MVQIGTQESVAPSSPAVAPEAPASKPVKKSPKKKVAKVKAKKAAAKKAKSNGKVGGPRKEGLRRFQERALKALKGGSTLTIEQLAKRAGISTVVIRRGLGPVNPDLFKSFDKEQGFENLQTLGLVKCSERSLGENGKENVYSLTARGNAAAGKIEKLPTVHPAPGDGKKKK